MLKIEIEDREVWFSDHAIERLERRMPKENKPKNYEKFLKKVFNKACEVRRGGVSHIFRHDFEPAYFFYHPGCNLVFVVVRNRKTGDHNYVKTIYTATDSWVEKSWKRYHQKARTYMDMLKVGEIL